MNEIFERNLTYFKVVKRYADRAQCICPCHNDKQASLTISKGDRCTLFKCFAGCNFEDILGAVGLDKKDTFYDAEPEKPKTNWKRYVESREKKKIEAVYNYISSVDGSYCFTKIRLEGKKILYGVITNERFTYGLPKGTSRKDFKAFYGDLETLKETISEGKTIFIVEGEKDVNTLTKQGYTAFTYGGCSDWQVDFAELVRGADVFILRDNDQAGLKVAQTILNDIKNLAKSAKIINPVPDIPKADITDFFESGKTKDDFEALLSSSTSEESKNNDGLSVSEVMELLTYKIDYDKDGNVKGRKLLQTVRNFEIILQNDFRLKGRLKFNEFSSQEYLVGSVPWDVKNNYRAWNSHDDSALFSLIQSEYGMTNRNDYFDAIKNVCVQSKFHPIKDILGSLVWDGKEHIKELLPNYLGVENTDYTFQVMRLFLLGAINRIYQPGCKFDYAMTLQGKQGLGKSTFLRLLALNDEWFSDSLDNLDSDKAVQSLMGSWIIELAELKALARTGGGIDSVKRFLSATQDKYRQPYARRADIFLRQCVFAGTTNKSNFLCDETGNRRFLIIQTGITKPSKNLFCDEAINDIRQAWAEAMHIYKNENPKLVLPKEFLEEAERLQAESEIDDGKTGIIEVYLKDKNRTCAIQIWREALGELGRPQKYQAAEINTILDNLEDWERMKSPYKFTTYGSQRGFQRKKNCSQNNEFKPIEEEEMKQLPF